MATPVRLLGTLLAATPLVAALAPRSQPITVWLAGDSTMAQKQPDKRPETGWGEALQPCFDSSEVRIANRAVNGRSTRSFIAEGRWQAIVDSLRAGDYVLIQFGHNDEKVGTDRYASPEDYARNLARFVTDVRAHGAQPVLLTPVVRRKFDGAMLLATHGAYPEAARRVAREHHVPLIDMTRASATLVQRLGPDSSRALWLHLEPGANPNYPAGVHDDTHFNPEGARVMASLALDAIRTAVPALAAHERGCLARTR
ncbi:MAG TPA: rhamnogalacturonan acetylesterase [Gemmatimonadaceae bacterium]|jgi:lysophospholipase L1-like esterase|nr:rhamnogalacturonan acetylesterase [Gemmatimonadaceae bacterium]